MTKIRGFSGHSLTEILLTIPPKEGTLKQRSNAQWRSAGRGLRGGTFGFSRHGGGEFLRGLGLGLGCFAAGFAAECAVLTLRGSAPRLAVYVSGFSLSGEAVRHTAADAALLGAGYVVLSGLMGLKWAWLRRRDSIWMGLGDNLVATNLLHVLSAGGADELQIVRVALAQLLSFGIVCGRVCAARKGGMES